MVTGEDAPLAASILHGMDGNDVTRLEKAHLGGGVVHLDDAAARAVWHAVEVAVDRAMPSRVMRRSRAQHCLEWSGKKLFKLRTFLGETLGDDTPGRGMHAHIGNLVEPLSQLLVEIVEVAEQAGEEEVLADVAERPLDLALRLGPYGLHAFGR